MALKKLFLLFAIVSLLFFGFGCPEDDDDDNNNNDVSTTYEASAAVNSNQEMMIETESGASLTIPYYAVPLSTSDETGTMVFSIERSEVASPILPSGYTSSSDIYRLGPDGFTFANPVKVTLPIEDIDTTREYELYRINPTTGNAEVYASEVDYDNAEISAFTYHFSEHAERSRSFSEQSAGCIRITNNSSTHSLHASVVDFTPLYEMSDTVTCSSFSGYYPARGSGSYVASSGLWHLPQGTYTLCFRMSEQGTISRPPGDPVHWYVYDVVIDEPWTRSNPRVSREFSYGSPGTDSEDGFCNCHPDPTPSAGTGDVQVTLTWHNAQSIDLDLWVYEPDSTLCSYMNDSTENGGILDRDNKCGSYINGRPENIFWSDAPSGQYRVVVDWYGDCGNDIASQRYDVRIVNGSSVRTYSGTIDSEENIEIATFTVSGATMKSTGNTIHFEEKKNIVDFVKPEKN